jgi:hypothetical protein
LLGHVAYTDPEETDGASTLRAMSRFAAVALTEVGASLERVDQIVEQYLTQKEDEDSHAPAAQLLVLAALSYEQDPKLLDAASDAMSEGYASVCQAILHLWLRVALDAVPQKATDVLWVYLGACAAVMEALGEYAGCGADQLMKEYWLHLMLQNDRS